ncbi:unnamed protein product, partial [Rotaria sordida]
NAHTPTPTLSSPPNESLPPNESPPSHDSTTSKKSSSSNEPSPSNDFSTTKKTPPSNNSPSSNNSRPEKITIYTPTSTLKKIIKEISADIQELFPPLFKKKTALNEQIPSITSNKIINFLLISSLNK